MDRIKHPPNEESAEELGEQIIQELLKSPSPPETLEEDLLETSARMANRNITLLQTAMAREKFSMLQRITSQTEQYLAGRPSLTKEEQRNLAEAATAFARKQIAELREHTHLLITALQVEWEKRDVSIRTFCRKNDPNDGTDAKDVSDPCACGVTPTASRGM